MCVGVDVAVQGCHAMPCHTHEAMTRGSSSQEGVCCMTKQMTHRPDMGPELRGDIAIIGLMGVLGPWGGGQSYKAGFSPHTYINKLLHIYVIHSGFHAWLR